MLYLAQPYDEKWLFEVLYLLHTGSAAVVGSMCCMIYTTDYISMQYWYLFCLFFNYGFVYAWCYWPCARTVNTTQIVAIYHAHGPFTYTMVNYRVTDQ